MFKPIITSLGVASAIALILGAGAAKADPVPNPPPETKLPPVFCFRFTNIKAIEDDPEGDKFQLSFEVLNWSNRPANGVRIALNTGSNSFVQDVAPVFAGAGVDANGRPLGQDADPLPGNQLFTNLGQVTESTETAVQWTAIQQDFNTLSAGAIPNADLLGVGPRNTPAACALVPGCTLVGSSPNPFFQSPQVSDWETVDNGNNVLDGFVLTVDDLDEAEVLSFNWNLLDENGDPIGMPGVGNEYGFGTVNIARIPINTDPESDFRIFPDNTGVSNSSRIFAENSHRVTEYADVDYDTVLAAPPPPNTIRFATNDTDDLIALFSAEFGPGLAAPFVNSGDNIFNSAINTQPIARGDGEPDPTDIPEPSTLLGLTVFGLLWAKSRSGVKAE